MNKIGVCIVFFIGLVVISGMPALVSMAQEQEEDFSDMIVQGVVEEISLDNSYVVVKGIKVLTESDFCKYCDLIVGDEVTIFVAESEEGLIALDCIFSEQSEQEDAVYDSEYLDDDNTMMYSDESEKVQAQDE